MADLVPHPLVTRLGMRIAHQKGVNLPREAERAATDLKEQAALAQVANKQAVEALVTALEAATESRSPEDPPASSGKGPEATTGQGTPDANDGSDPGNPSPPPGLPSSFDPIDIDDLRPDQKQDLATALANAADLPDLTLFAGFLGGKVVNPANDGEWRLVYLDSRLYSWLLVREDDILVHQRLADDRAPSGLRDVLWVRGTASVIQGTGPRSTEGRFLVGEFTRAGDFAASTTGGTFSAASGLLCEATTPGCCIPKRTG